MLDNQHRITAALTQRLHTLRSQPTRRRSAPSYLSKPVSVFTHLVPVWTMHSSYTVDYLHVNMIQAGSNSRAWGEMKAD